MKLRELFDKAVITVTARLTYNVLSRLDNENTALRHALAASQKMQGEFIHDLGALARGYPLKTAAAAAVEHYILSLKGERDTALKQLECARRYDAAEPQLPAPSLTRPEANEILSRPDVTPADATHHTETAANFSPPSDVVYNTGRDKWTHGERNSEGRRYLGPCPICGSRTLDHGGPWFCQNPRGCTQARPRAPMIVPSWWNTNVVVRLDGVAWCASRTDKPMLTAYGNTPAAAVANLQTAELSN